MLLTFLATSLSSTFTMSELTGSKSGVLPQLKPSVSQALWGHLLQRNVPAALKGNTSLSASSVPVAPVDKAGTSMRMLLHDTQATLEKFSTHIEKLTSRVEDAKREVSTAHKVFQLGHEKLVEENVSLREWSSAYTQLYLLNLVLRYVMGYYCV